MKQAYIRTTFKDFDYKEIVNTYVIIADKSERWNVMKFSTPIIPMRWQESEVSEFQPERLSEMAPKGEAIV